MISEDTREGIRPVRELSAFKNLNICADDWRKFTKGKDEKKKICSSNNKEDKNSKNCEFFFEAK